MKAMNATSLSDKLIVLFRCGLPNMSEVFYSLTGRRIRPYLQRWNWK